MKIFDEFMALVKDAEYELEKDFKDFTVEDFLELEDEMDEAAFKDEKVIAKLKECDAIVDIKKDTKTKGTVIKLKDGTEGVFGV